MKKKRKRRRGGIAWQNKDITSKVMAENFKGKTFAAYGLDLPGVVDVKPTDLPAIEANEMRIDNVFVLEDGSWAIVDYESAFRSRNRLKYLGYVVRLAKRMYNEGIARPSIRMIVIYTADVRRRGTEPVLDLGAVRLRMEEAFLSELDPKGIRKAVEERLERGEPVGDVDLMRLVVYPLTFVGTEEKKRAVGETIDLAERIPDAEQRVFALAAINVFSDKVISRVDRDRIRRTIKMTKLGREMWEDALKEGEEKGMKEGMKKGEEKGMERERNSFAEKMLRAGEAMSKIMDYTGLSEEQIRTIKGTIPQPV